MVDVNEMAADAIIIRNSIADAIEYSDLMQNPAFDPAETAILHGAEDSLAAEDDSSATATINAYTATEITIQVESNAPGYLLLTDAYYPGWQASINGDAVPIIRADVMFRAVEIPAGSSTIIFTYRPDWLLWD